jgi:hypothetical protein
MALAAFVLSLSTPAFAVEGLRGRDSSDIVPRPADARIGMLSVPREDRFPPVLGLCLLSGLVLSGALALVRELRREREDAGNS